MRPVLLLLPTAVLLSAAGLAQEEIRITEYMYKGAGGEFFELTNTGQIAVDLTGWSFDDSDALPGNVDLSSLGILDAGESAIVTETNAALFELDWGLSGVTILGDNAMGNLNRNDTIYLFDAGLQVHDILRYGDEDFPGSKRADGESVYACNEVLGQDFCFGWRKSGAGDGVGSVISLSGDEGNPGSYVGTACTIYSYCAAEANSSGFGAEIMATGSFDAIDNDLTLTAKKLPFNQFGYFLASQTQSFVAMPPGSEGNLCLGGQIARFKNDIQNSGLIAEFSLLIDLTDIPTNPIHSVMAGETWNFSTWYRDNNPGPTSNFTNGVSVTFE
ncbi:MAG: lamin tail domain-containing protein [Planctomycetota bacterium]|nr:lamin tail domain-containing protein [Planctomycetota bacterium]